MTAALPVARSAYCEGHFPGRPILPAVALLALVVEQLSRESQRPLPLRTIPFLRLRQLVAPGDRLTLAARKAANGARAHRGDARRAWSRTARSAWSRATGRRVGAAHRSVRRGRARPARNAASAATADALRRLRSSARCPTAWSASARMSGAPARSHRSAPAFAAVEAAAQTAALWEAVRRWRAGGAGPRVGYLVALRDVAFFAAEVPAEAFWLRRCGSTPPRRRSRTTRSRSVAGVPVLRGTIATYLA